MDLGMLDHALVSRWAYSSTGMGPDTGGLQYALVQRLLLDLAARAAALPQTAAATANAATFTGPLTIPSGMCMESPLACQVIRRIRT